MKYKSLKYILTLNSKSQAGNEVQQSDEVEPRSVCPTCTKPLVGSSALFFEVTPITTETCLNCEHRERHQCGGSIIQYCGVSKSNRTYNGKLKIKCKTPACSSFKKNR